jgi:hypothetical protein
MQSCQKHDGDGDNGGFKSTFVQPKHLLHQYMSRFTLCFIIF